MTATFPSPEWFAAALPAVAGCRGADPTASAAVQYRATDAEARWVEVIADGQLVAWELGELDHPDLIIDVPLAVARGAVAGTLDGAAVLGAITTSTPDAHEPVPPSPMDLGHGAPTDALPRFPGATVAVQYLYDLGPWGPVPFALTFVDGQIESMALERLDDPDVVARCTFRHLALVRRGDIGILDVLVDGGTVEGSEGALALLGGISESPEFQALERACGPSGLVLAALGEVHGAAGFAAGLAGLDR